MTTKFMERNARGEITFNLAGKTLTITPNWALVDKIEQEYGSLFEMDYAFSGDENEARKYKTSDLMKAVRLLTGEQLQDIQDEDLFSAMMEVGLMRFEIIIKALLTDIAVSGTGGKKAGK